MHGVFTNGYLPSTSAGGQPRPIETACVLGNLLGSPDQQITRGLLLAPGVGVFVRWSLVLGKDGKISFQLCMYVCVYMEMHVLLVFLGRW